MLEGIAYCTSSLHLTSGLGAPCLSPDRYSQANRCIMGKRERANRIMFLVRHAAHASILWASFYAKYSSAPRRRVRETVVKCAGAVKANFDRPGARGLVAGCSMRAGPGKYVNVRMRVL